MLPNLMSAERRASRGVMPARTLSSICSARLVSISSASSCSRRRLLNGSVRRTSQARMRLIKPPSLVSKRHHRIDIGGASGRQIGGERRNKDHQQSGDGNRQWVVRGEAEEETRDESCEGQCANKA